MEGVAFEGCLAKNFPISADQRLDEEMRRGWLLKVALQKMVFSHFYRYLDQIPQSTKNHKPTPPLHPQILEAISLKYSSPVTEKKNYLVKHFEGVHTHNTTLPICPVWERAATRSFVFYRWTVHLTKDIKETVPSTEQNVPPCFFS